MSTQASNTRSESTANPAAKLDVLGDDCARTIDPYRHERRAKDGKGTDETNGQLVGNGLPTNQQPPRAISWRSACGSRTTVPIRPPTRRLSTTFVRIDADGINVAISDSDG